MRGERPSHVDVLQGPRRIKERARNSRFQARFSLVAWLALAAGWWARTGSGHTGADAVVCLVGTRRRSELRADPPAL